LTVAGVVIVLNLGSLENAGALLRAGVMTSGPPNLVGTVEGADGRPIVGAIVFVSAEMTGVRIPIGGQVTRPTLAQTVSGFDGRFGVLVPADPTTLALAQLNGGALNVTVNALGGYQNDRGFGSWTLPMQLSPDGRSFHVLHSGPITVRMLTGPRA
jgi:hypothetical protein